mmetsp:Transcript_4875/g.9297  ORF Transcript_4875/g.9297 Transcript_4875/m.9297 type:complete len:560 (+) Transcript_4875:313-1992(+)
MHSHLISPAESPLRKRKRIFEYDTMDHCQQHQQEQELIHDQVIVSKYDNAIITAPDTIATVTESTTESSQSSHGDSSTFRTMEYMLPSALPSIVTCAKGRSCRHLQERTSHLDMMRYYHDSREISSSSVSYWLSPDHHVLCDGYRRQDDDDNLFLMHQDFDDCRQDLGFLDTNHAAVVTPRKGKVENFSSDTDDDTGDWDCDLGRGSVKDFGTALNYNAHVAITNAEWMHRVVENIRMDCSYSDYDCDCEDLDDYEINCDYGTKEEEEEEMLLLEQEEDAPSGSSLMYDENITLRYNFVKMDDFYKERHNVMEQEENLTDEAVLDDVCHEKETSYNDIQQENYSQMIEYEREFIVTQIEPACNEMKNIVDSFVGLGLGLGLGQSMQCDCIDYDSTQENRWYAQISSNVHGIYYYQPSTGAISRSEPFSYMDTSQVRCLDDNYYNGSMMSCEKEPKYLAPIAIDNDSVKVVSPVRQQQLTTVGKYKEKKNATLKNVRLIFICTVLLTILAVFSQRYGFGTKNTDAMTRKSSVQGGLMDFSPHQCPPLPLFDEIDNTCPLL